MRFTSVSPEYWQSHGRWACQIDSRTGGGGVLPGAIGGVPISDGGARLGTFTIQAPRRRRHLNPSRHDLRVRRPRPAAESTHER